MDEIDKLPPAITLPELGIHIGYVIKKQNEMDIKLDNMANNFAHKSDLADAILQRKEDDKVLIADIACIDTRVCKLEEYISSISRTIARWAVVALVLMVLTVYGLEALFK